MIDITSTTMEIFCQLQFASEAYVVLLALEKTGMQSTEETPPNFGDSEDERYQWLLKTANQVYFH